MSTAGHLHAWTAGPVDVPDKPLDERFDLLLSRVENVERWVAEVEGKLDRQGRELREHASEEAQSAYGRMASRLAQMERTALQVRVNDALIFIVGVGFTLAGALVGTTGC